MRHANHTSRGGAGILVLGMTLCVLSVSPAWAQGFNPPRLANGRPDLNGIWQALNAANYDLEPHIARSAMEQREGPQGPVPAVGVLRLGAVGAVPGSLGVVDGGQIPYTADARALKDENRAKWLERDPEVRCYMPGVPRATGSGGRCSPSRCGRRRSRHYIPLPFQIVQSETDIFVAYEYAGAVRDIYLDDRGPAPVDSWMGQSDGRWEGDTLVVRVTGQNDQTWFDRAGSHHSN